MKAPGYNEFMVFQFLTLFAFTFLNGLKMK